MTHWSVWSHGSSRSHRSIVASHVTSRSHPHWSSWSHRSTRPHWTSRSHTHWSSRPHWSHRSTWSHWTSRTHWSSWSHAHWTARAHHHSIWSARAHHVSVHHLSIWPHWTSRAHSIGSHWSTRSSHWPHSRVHHWSTSSHRPHAPRTSIIKRIVSEDRVTHHVHVAGGRLARIHWHRCVLTRSPFLFCVPPLIASCPSYSWKLEPTRHVSRSLDLSTADNGCC